MGIPTAITITEADFYLQKPAGSPPPQARLLLCYEALVDMLADVEHWLFLHSDGAAHEVWEATDLGRDLHLAALPPEALRAPYAPFSTEPLLEAGWRLGRIVAFTGPDWSADVARELVGVLLRGRFRHEYFRGVVHEGLLTGADWKAAVDALTRELEGNRRAALERAERVPSVLVETARELRLQPEPSRTSPTSWSANCPGTHHWIGINAESERWGCGYCKRNGGPEELRAFVTERKAAEAVREARRVLRGPG